MQEPPENADTLPSDDETPFSSEALDSVTPEEPLATAQIPVPVPSEDPQDLLAAAQKAEEVAKPSGNTPAEPPDGEVIESADDLLTDANAVDPKIDISLLEAYLFSTHSPLTPGRLAELFNLESTKPIRKAIRALNEQYEQTKRCFRVEQVAGGFQLLTLPDYGEPLKALHQREQDAKLTKAALETLAIIAYKQPILRADLEAIRGVASGETIRSLMEKHLVKIAGRAEEPGRPILYGSTKRFLEVFGLNSLKDLPQPEGLQARAKKASALLDDTDTPMQAGEQALPDQATESAIPPSKQADISSDLPTESPILQPVPIDPVEPPLSEPLNKPDKYEIVLEPEQTPENEPNP